MTTRAAPAAPRNGHEAGLADVPEVDTEQTDTARIRTADGNRRRRGHGHWQALGPAEAIGQVDQANGRVGGLGPTSNGYPSTPPRPHHTASFPDCCLPGSAPRPSGIRFEQQRGQRGRFVWLVMGSGSGEAARRDPNYTATRADPTKPHQKAPLVDIVSIEWGSSATLKSLRHLPSHVKGTGRHALALSREVDAVSMSGTAGCEVVSPFSSCLGVAHSPTAAADTPPPLRDGSRTSSSWPRTATACG